jgi:hypothetical protein
MGKGFQRHGDYPESEAVQRLMRLMSDRSYRTASASPPDQRVADESGRNTFLSRIAQSKNMAEKSPIQRNSQSTETFKSADSADVLKRAEKMRREVEIALDSVRRQKEQESDQDFHSEIRNPISFDRQPQPSYVSPENIDFVTSTEPRQGCPFPRCDQKKYRR